MKTESNPKKSPFSPHFAIILILTLCVPVLVLPNLVDNAFNTPKTLLMMIGAVLMVAAFLARYFQGKAVPVSRTSVSKIVFLLICLNCFSFFYTKNYYFTTVAAAMNISCLLIFYFVALYVDGKGAFWIIITAAFSGLLVSIITCLQFTGYFLLFKWAHPGIMVMGTIGNSNYVGTYFIFPLFAMLGSAFLIHGKWRIIPFALFLFMIAAFLFTRARAGWMGFFLSLPVFLIIMRRIYGFSLRKKLKMAFTYAFVIAAILISFWHIAPERFHTMMDFRNVTRSDTLLLRMQKYYRSSFWLFKQNPIFGTGLWSYRNQVYFAQAEINKIDPEYFKNYPEPKPRRVHTDYLEILNDGGLISGAALLLFLIIVMQHGWSVIKDENVHQQERIITSSAFVSIIAIMLAAFFFFPFRINSTMFMTVLMMGLMEGIFLRNYQLISDAGGLRSPARFVLIPIILLALIGIVWFTGIKPIKGEIEHFKYKKALAKNEIKEAEKYILKAIDYDPHNSAYCLYASQLYSNALKDFGKARDFIERSIIDYNGDITMWSVYYIKGLLNFQSGSLFEARAAFEKSLYYNPVFEPAKQKLGEVSKVIKDHDRVLIKFR